MSNRKLYTGLIALLVIVAVIVGVTVNNSSKHSTSNDTMSSMQNAQSTNKVSISNYMFGPMAIKVKVGTTVTWTNRDAVNHTVTADNPSSDAPSSMDIGQGKSFSYTFKKAGTYTYHCFPHPYMHGTVEVTNS